MFTDTFQTGLDILNLVEIVGDYVVEFFMKIQIFGIAAHKLKMRVVFARDGHKVVADFDPHSTGWVHGGEQLACLATHFQNALLGLNNEP